MGICFSLQYKNISVFCFMRDFIEKIFDDENGALLKVSFVGYLNLAVFC